MRNRTLTFLLSTFLLHTSPALLAQDGFGLNTGSKLPLVRSSILPVEEAFVFNAFIEVPDNVVLLWEIADGYYLYRDSIRITFGKESVVADIGALPPAEPHTDEFFGDTEIYRDRLLVRFPWSAVEADVSAAMHVHYQGCAEDKYCYPEKVNNIVLMLPR